jgi:YggT family protein
MFVIQNFFAALAYILHLIIMLYIYIIIARAIISWLNVDPYNSFVRLLFQITEPVLYRIRRYLPNMGGIDISPLVVIFVLIFIDRFVVATLRQMAM